MGVAIVHYGGEGAGHPRDFRGLGIGWRQLVTVLGFSLSLSLFSLVQVCKGSAAVGGARGL